MTPQPLAIDLYCGLGGWTEGLLAEGYRVVGFDNERHKYGEAKYPGQLVIQDVLTLHGSQFKDAALIVASPPCQEYSYMAMPWTLAKEKRARILADAAEQKRLTALFDACFRIQREASEAAGRHIPLIVENVKGAQPWVGRAAWHFGSFYLWGDIPALMPITIKRLGVKNKGRNMSGNPDARWGSHNISPSSDEFAQLVGSKNNGGSWFNVGSPGQKETNRNPVTEGVKQAGISGVRNNGKGDRWFQDGAAKNGSKSPARKAASAAIAKIPFVLAQHIARSWKPDYATV